MVTMFGCRDKPSAEVDEMNDILCDGDGCEDFHYTMTRRQGRMEYRCLRKEKEIYLKIRLAQYIYGQKQELDYQYEDIMRGRV